jgi:hypothetical protein
MLMSQQTQEYARWLYNLFSQLAPYWERIFDLERAFEAEQIVDIVRAMLEQEGCETINSDIFQCGDTYMRVASMPTPKAETIKGYPLTLVFTVLRVYIYIYYKEISFILNNRKVMLHEIRFEGPSSTGALDLYIAFYVSGVKEPFSFLLKVFPTTIEWYVWLMSMSDLSLLEQQLGITVPDVLSAIFNNREAKAILEDGVKRLTDIVFKVLHTIVIYLLY